jgi:type IV pilus assembly protein PilP
VVRIDEHRMEVRERLYIAGGWQQRSRFLALGKGAFEEGVRDEVVEAGNVRDAADELQAGTG